MIVITMMEACLFVLFFFFSPTLVSALFVVIYTDMRGKKRLHVCVCLAVPLLLIKELYYVTKWVY